MTPIFFAASAAVWLLEVSSSAAGNVSSAECYAARGMRIAFLRLCPTDLILTLIVVPFEGGRSPEEQPLSSVR